MRVVRPSRHEADVCLRPRSTGTGRLAVRYTGNAAAVPALPRPRLRHRRARAYIIAASTTRHPRVRTHSADAAPSRHPRVRASTSSKPYHSTPASAPASTPPRPDPVASSMSASSQLLRLPATPSSSIPSQARLSSTSGAVSWLHRRVEPLGHHFPRQAAVAMSSLRRRSRLFDAPPRRGGSGYGRRRWLWHIIAR